MRTKQLFAALLTATALFAVSAPPALAGGTDAGGYEVIANSFGQDGEVILVCFIVTPSDSVHAVPFRVCEVGR